MPQLSQAEIRELQEIICDTAERQKDKIEALLAKSLSYETYTYKMVKLAKLLACYGPQTLEIQYCDEHALHQSLPIPPTLGHVESTDAFKQYEATMHEAGFTGITLKSVSATALTVEVRAVLTRSLDEPAPDASAYFQVAYAAGKFEEAADTLLTRAFNAVSNDTIVEAVAATRYADPQRLYVHIPEQREESQRHIHADKLTPAFITSNQGYKDLVANLKHLGISRVEVDSHTSHVIGLRIG